MLEKNSKIGEALCTVIEILEGKDVDVVVTGTTGLSILDVTPEGYIPNDIDLKISRRQMDSELKRWFKEQEKMLGIKSNSDYKDESYVLMVKGVKVNVLVSPKDEIECFELTSNFSNSVKYISVETPFNILKEKDMLNRCKDKDFIISLINRLTSLYQ